MHAYYPEMGGKPLETALFKCDFVMSKMALKWTADRHAEALATFRSMRIRPTSMAPLADVQFCKDGIARKYTAIVTYAAYEKLRNAKLTTTELLLD